MPTPEKRPVSAGVRGQLGAVVHAHELGRTVIAGDDSGESADRAVGVDPPFDLDRERLARVLIDDVQALQDAAVGVVSNWKSSAHTWFGRCARSLAAGVVDDPSR